MKRCSIGLPFPARPLLSIHVASRSTSITGSPLRARVETTLSWFETHGIVRGGRRRRIDPMAQTPRPGEGRRTEHYPSLGTGVVSYEDCISPEFYQLEREAVFKRAWLNVGRVEEVPRPRGCFTNALGVA